MRLKTIRNPYEHARVGGMFMLLGNLIESIPEVTTVWQADPMLGLLREVLGEGVGLVRALFFDKAARAYLELALA